MKVFEKQLSLGIPAGGLRAPPDMSKILKAWAGVDGLAKISVLNVGTPWHNCEAANRIARTLRDANSDVDSGDRREDGLCGVATRGYARDWW